MNRIALLLAVALAFATPGTAAQATTSGSPCMVATPADIAAAHLNPVQTLGQGPKMCTLVWSSAQGRAIEVFLRPLQVRGGDQIPFAPGMCAKMLAAGGPNSGGQKTRSCKELPGYGTFAVLIGTDSDPKNGRNATFLIFLGAHERVTIAASGGVPGGDAAAVQRLGKILAPKYR